MIQSKNSFVVLLCSLVAGLLAGAMTIPLRAEEVVGVGANPSVGADGALQSIVVWEGDDGDGDGILAQRYDGLGMPVGATFVVNEPIAGSQREPAATALANGSLVVVWESDHEPRPMVFGRVLDSLGMPVGTVFQAVSRGRARLPAIGAGDDGTFVLVWSGAANHGKGPSFRPHVRRFDSVGMPLGAARRFGKNSAANPPAVAVADDGAFLVTWSNRRNEVEAQAFDSLGMPVGGAARVNAAGTGEHLMPAAAATPDGGYTVVWERKASAERDVLSRHVDSNGMPLGAEIQVSLTPFIHPASPAVASDDAGDTLAVWRCQGDDESGHAVIYARRLSAVGMPLGAEIQVNVSSAQHLEPDVAATDDEGFIVVWQRQDDEEDEEPEVLRRELDLD